MAQHDTHTPGPWDYDMDFIVAPDPDGRHPDIYIAEIAHSDDEGRIASSQQQDANRRLIAAAPDLLEALEYAHAILGRIYDGEKVTEQEIGSTLHPSSAAIAKASGRAA
jgi:hypothetical protein